MDRTEFLQRGAMFGLSAGIMGSMLAFVGEAGAAPAATTPARSRSRRAARFGPGITKPAGPIEPYLLNDGGALCFAGQAAEYLTFTNPQGKVVPWLATSWKPNADATVWTFQLRKGVKFHNGKTMTVEGRRREHEAVRDGERDRTPA